MYKLTSPKEISAYVIAHLISYVYAFTLSQTVVHFVIYNNLNPYSLFIPSIILIIVIMFVFFALRNTMENTGRPQTKEIIAYLASAAIGFAWSAMVTPRLYDRNTPAIIPWTAGFVQMLVVMLIFFFIRRMMIPTWRTSAVNGPFG